MFAMIVRKAKNKRYEIHHHLHHQLSSLSRWINFHKFLAVGEERKLSVQYLFTDVYARQTY